jgi:acyl-CoA synthetase (NDP forming)/GNAT superfamily N-acetyltransferase
MPTVGSDRWVSTVVLGDGDTAVVRPITPADRIALAEFHARQSDESKYRRYFSAKPTLSASELTHFTELDFVDRVALVVERHGEFIAWASYERWPNRSDAEAAFMVDDSQQGLGIATLLLEHLAAIARTNGINRFTAEVLADNRPMMVVFTRAGWPVERHFDSGVIDVEFSLDNTAEFIDSVERREQRADSRAIARLLIPRSIALIGASETPGGIGTEIWDNLRNGFSGPLYAVNPHRDRIGDERCYPTVSAIDAEVSLAVIAVPEAALEAAIMDCIAAQVRGAVIITAVNENLINESAHKALLLPELIATARRNGLRIIGPASFGFASTLPDVAIQAAMVPVTLPPGGVAISLQSGTLASSVLLMAAELQMGLSWFVSLGDKSDVSGNDLLQFWEDDAATSVIAMYTESFGNPRKFARLARRVSQTRPIVAVRTGSAMAGAAGSALYRQCGVIEVPTVAAMLDTARVLATQPLMASRRVAVLTNARSPGVLTEAALRAADLEVVAVPRTLNWSSSDDEFGEALKLALAADHIDSVVVVHAPPTTALSQGPITQIDQAARNATKPVVAVMLGARDGTLLPGSNVQKFSFPEPAAAVLGRLYAYSAWRASEGASTVEVVADVDHPQAEALITNGLIASDATVSSDTTAEKDSIGVNLEPTVIKDLLATYGIAMADCRLVPAEMASEAANEIGYPVAVKAARRHTGRSVQAGVALDVADSDDLTRVVRQMQTHLGADADWIIVQQMVTPGVDLRVHVTTDERLGPVVTVGLGGAQADVIGDESSRLAPISEAAAVSMLASTRVAATLSPQSTRLVTDLIRRVAQLAADHPEIIEIDVNPVLVSERGATVVDARCRLAPAPTTETALRRLE